MRAEPIIAAIILLSGCVERMNQFPPVKPYIERELILPDYSGMTEQDKREMGLLEPYELPPKGSPFDPSRYDGSREDVHRCSYELQISSAVNKDPEICYNTAPSKEKKEWYKYLDNLHNLPIRVRVIE